ncbi:MAG TPA: hypothetical protein VNN79_24900 [Actinomycetota bacterium]|nr:hypothetical protein [Actinomycetota bacterium]
MVALRSVSRMPGSVVTHGVGRRARRIGVALATTVASAAFVLGAPAASAARACVAWTGGAQPSNPGIVSNNFTATAVLSPCYAWAVGTWRNNAAEHQTLIEHFNGSVWTFVPSPTIGTEHDDLLNGVAVTSKSNAWAVGNFDNGSALQTLVLHWNGSSWAHKKSPNPGGGSFDDELYAVAATSATNAWAVGRFRQSGTSDQTLIERWNGTAWKVVPSPTPGGSAVLYAVGATSASNAWAAGVSFNGAAYETLILRWNGSVWKRVPSPNPGGTSNNNFLRGVSVTSASDAWAVGQFYNGTAFRTLILHWNGKAWKVVPSPNPGGTSNDNALYGIAATSSTNAVAVGDYHAGSVLQTLTERWNGSHWKWAWSPNPSGPTKDNALFGVAASSSGNVWAVGYAGGPPDLTLAMHCC